LQDDRLNDDEKEESITLREELLYSRREHERLRETMRREHESEKLRLKEEYKTHLFATTPLHNEHQKRHGNDHVDTTHIINHNAVSKHSFSVANVQKLAAIHRKRLEKAQQKHKEESRAMRNKHNMEKSRLRADHEMQLHKECQNKHDLLDTTHTIDNATTVSKHSFSVSNIQKLAAIHRQRLQKVKQKHKKEANVERLAAIHRERQRLRNEKYNHEKEKADLLKHHELKLFTSLHAERQKLAHAKHSHEKQTDDFFQIHRQRLQNVQQKHKQEDNKYGHENADILKHHELKLFTSLHAERQKLAHAKYSHDNHEKDLLQS